MPIYPYECLECKNKFEVFGSLKEVYSESFIAECTECQSQICRRLISRTSFSLKGKGWYKDGYSSKHVKNEE